MQFAIYRYDPDRDSKPYMQEYQLDPSKCRGVMLLDALETLKVKDSTLAFRRSCGEGVCGSDGMSINGKNGLACITPLSSLGKRVELRPLPAFPVIRDLIVDMEPFYQQNEKVKPYLQNNEAAPQKERLQSQEQRAKLDGLYECILCGCCTSSCPSYWWNQNRESSQQFLGPAALLAATRFVVDSRDTATQERLADLQDPFSLYRCRGVMNCVDVCPKHLNPTKAIGKLRTEMLKRAV